MDGNQIRHFNFYRLFVAEKRYIRLLSLLNDLLM